MRASDVRRWVEGRREAEARDLASLQPAGDAQRSWSQALALFALLGRMVSWPVPPDDIRRREDAEVASAWAKIRSASRQHS